MGTPEGCFGADDKLVLASTGREAYAGQFSRRFKAGAPKADGRSPKALEEALPLLYSTVE